MNTWMPFLRGLSRPLDRPAVVCPALVFALYLTATAAHAQIGGHVDVQFGYDNGRIWLNKAVYSHVFPKTGISRQFTTNPGFYSEDDLGLGLTAGDTVVYHVLDDLMFWNGIDFGVVEPATQLHIGNNPPNSLPDTIVGAGTGRQEGRFNPPTNRIGSALSSGDFHYHLKFQLEPWQDRVLPPPPAFGAYGIKLQLATSAPSIEESDPFFIVFNFGLEEEVFQRGLSAYSELLRRSDLPGDYNANQQLDAEDLDRQAEVLLGIRPFEERFDENNDGQVSLADREIWLSTLRRTWVGDSNLDSEFNTTDLIHVLAAGKYETDYRAGWAEGDWNGDLRFNTADLIAALSDGGYEQGSFLSERGLASISVAQVPEPPSGTLFLTALCLLAAFRRSLRGPDGTWNSIRQTGSLFLVRRCL